MDARKALRRVGLANRDGLRPRPLVQWGALILTLALGIRFALFVNQFRSGMPPAVTQSRPAGVEAFLPIGGLVALKAWLTTGWWDTVHPAALALLLTFLAVALFLRRGFCSWLCPIGTVSEALGRLGRWLFGFNLKPPAWLDRLLMVPKYLLLLFFLQAVWLGMPGPIARQFLQSAYYQASDVKMLQFFLAPSLLTVQVLVLLAVLSLLVENFWCRYLCPYGALLGLVGWLSPVAVTRRPSACTDCRLCDRVCPARIQVSRARTVLSPECNACLNCIEACPARARGALELRLTGAPRAIRPWGYTTVLVGLVLLAVTVARITGRWDSTLTARDYARLVPAIEDIQH